MMFSQCDTPFTEQPNLLTPRLAFQIMGRRPGAKLEKALCPVLVVMTQEDDLISPDLSRSVASKASESMKMPIFYRLSTDTLYHRSTTG